MIRISQPVLFITIILVCQKSQAQLTAKENSIPKQTQIISTVQDTPKKGKPLAISDRVPDFAFSFLNYSSPDGSLSSFKGKLIVLDFWASWCYFCLHAFPKLDKLQKDFSDILHLILVNNAETTGDSRDKVVQTVKKYSASSSLPFLISYNDKVAFKLFPHYSLPHYVWIIPNGIVKTITEADELTPENIKAILENENVELSLSVKMDYLPNKLKDHGLDGQPVINENLVYYSIFKKGKIHGLRSINARRHVLDKDGVGSINREISMRNIPLIELFETATPYSKKRVDGDISKRVFFEIKDSSKLIFNPSVIMKEAWEKDNLYKYDLVIPEFQMNNIDEFIWRDLNGYSGYLGHIETRNLNCLVLTDGDKVEFDLSRTGNVFLFVCFLNVSATSYTQLVSITRSNARLEDILKEIYKQTGFSYSSRSKDMNEAKPTTIDVRLGPITTALNNALKNVPLMYSLGDKIIIIKRFTQTELKGNPNIIPIVIKGKVVDEKGKPVFRKI